MLDTVPPGPIGSDGPAFGTYVGQCADTDLQLGERGVSRLRGALSEKRWHWFCGFDDKLALGGAIVDAGLFGTAFLWVFDRRTGELLDDRDVVVPAPLLSVSSKPGGGDLARIDIPRRRLRLTRDGDRLRVTGEFGATSLAVTFSGFSRPMTAICPVDGRAGGVNVTQKETSGTVNGFVELDDKYHIDGTGMADYSHGLLGRVTAWHWAIGNCTDDEGREIGFNLVGGFNDGLENVIWIDGEPQAVGAAQFDPGESGTDDEWAVRSTCGTVDLTLAVEGVRTQAQNFGVVSSEYRQPLGRWSGTIADRAVRGVGVAEFHRSKW